MSTQARHANVGLARSLEGAGVLNPRWAQAFLQTPRHEFLPGEFWASTDDGYVRLDVDRDPESWLAAAYADTAAVTQWDDGSGNSEHREPTSSASMPTMVAEMLGALDAGSGDKVLEIGTGTGWTAALLAAAGAHVTTVEVDPLIAARARDALERADAKVELVVGDGEFGYPQGAPFDRVHGTAAARRIPGAWLEQTRPGGIVVVPFAPLFGGGAVARLTAAGDGSASGRFTGASAFMLLRGQRYQAPPVDDYLPGDWPSDAARDSTELDPQALSEDWLGQFAVALALPDVYYRTMPLSDGGRTWWLFDTAVTSWATVDSVPGASEFDVRQSGPRRLWHEVTAAWERWESAGRPGFDRFGLTVTPDGQHRAWLDEPARHWPVPA